MKRALTIQQELTQIHTVEDLTEVFESIASLHIAKIRDRVVASKEFFTELWQTYQGLRIDPKAQLARHTQAKKAQDVFVLITAEGKLSGQIDEQIVEAMQAAYQTPAQTDIIAIGSHGVAALRRMGVPIAKSFQLPAGDANFTVTPIVEELNQYRHISVFYQTYESLRVQKVAHIELISAVRELGEAAKEEQQVVSSRDYIFEPNIDQIADYMESVMMGVALGQVIMESKLAQYASRFNAMSTAKRRAMDLVVDYRHQYYRAKRAETDERLKEMIKVIKYRGHSRTN
ncbi:MAG TPA: F0F1 ATP synthase subunit gamma [Candidatus Saccharimonadales bacterium]|nr:F0F1 ATP synthase subunit gamma [Candidatus Saccharimonadales bacterium]